MTLFTDILNLINDYEEKLKGTHTIEIIDNLPVHFSNFVWDDREQEDQDLYGSSLFFTFSITNISESEGDSLCYYTDVKVECVGYETYEFSVHFGELEEGDIDIDRITVKDEIDYSNFIKVLEGYINHTYVVSVSK